MSRTETTLQTVIPNNFGPAESGYYKHKRICDNCFREIKYDIVKGKRVPTILECIYCGCETDGNWAKDRK